MASLGWRVDGDIPAIAVTLYCFFGALCAAMTLTLLVRRLVPGTSRAVIWTGSATIALATSMPWILRTPTVYQVAISAAFFFMMAGLLVLVRELLREESPRRGRLAAAGTLFGLAVLSRPTMAFVVVGGSTKLDVAGTSFPLIPQQTAEVTIVSPNNRNARLTFRAQTRTPGTFLVFQSAADKTTSTLVRNGSAGTLPLHLHRGVNYVIVGLTAGVDVPSGASVEVRLRDIRLR